MPSLEHPSYPCLAPADFNADTSLQLPEGYTFAQSISADRISELAYPTRSPEDVMYEREVTAALPGGYTFDVAVRHETDGVVGLGSIQLQSIASPAATETYAGLYNFFVEPDHRGLGLGKAILRARVRIAETMSPNLYVATLSDTNVLKDYYLTQGFRRGPGMPDLYRGNLPRLARNGKVF